jgi:hypothetical protein
LVVKFLVWLALPWKGDYEFRRIGRGRHADVAIGEVPAMPASTVKSSASMWPADRVAVTLVLVGAVIVMSATYPLLGALVLSVLLPMAIYSVVRRILNRFTSWVPRRCPFCDALNVCTRTQATPIATCGSCERQFKKIGLAWREIHLEKPLPRLPAGLRRRYRAYDSPPLAQSALEPVVADRSTCGRLLSTKRTSDPRDLIHRDSPHATSAKPKPAPGMLTALELLLWRKQARHGLPRTAEAGDGGGLWDRWLDE